MTAAFDDQFEVWLNNRLQRIKDIALKKFQTTTERIKQRSRSSRAMSRHTSPAGYYQFVYQDDDDDEDGELDRTEPTPPVDLEPELSPRRQRFASLLGTDALKALDIMESDEFDNIGHELDMNRNHREIGNKPHLSRAHDYSTTSLEFSDLESIVSDSLGRRSDDERVSSHSHDMDEMDEIPINPDPLSFVEISYINGGGGDDAEQVELSQQRVPARRAGKRPQVRQDQLVSIRYHKDNPADSNNDDFIDDDELLRRLPPGSDVMMTSFNPRDVAREESPMSSMLPVDLTEMTMEPDDFSSCDVHRDRDPIVRVDDPEFGPIQSHTCCGLQRTWARRLFVLTGIVALSLGSVLLIVLIYLLVT